jgi:TonB family protein
MLAAAKSHDQAVLTAFIKETEIPGYETWYTATFGQEKGESWADPYGKMLEQHERQFQDLLTRLASQDGKISVQKIDARKRYDTLRGRLDLFLADWKPSGSRNDSKIGYFMFVDGKFRWDSTVEFMDIHHIDISEVPAPRNDANGGSAVDQTSPSSGGKPNDGPFQSGKDGVGFPTCVYCPDPMFTEEAKKAKFQGTVLLRVVVGADGLTTNVQIVKSPGLGLDQKAIEAVQGWRFRPALGPHGKPVAVVIPIELTFRNLQ